MYSAPLKHSMDASSVTSIRIGRPLRHLARGSDGPTMVQGKGWDLPTGSYTAHQIVEANAPLLETCIFNLAAVSGPTTNPRELLLDNLASSLSIGTREASIEIPFQDPTRSEIARQALRIGRVLVEYARNVFNVQYDPSYRIYGPAQGHRLKPLVSQLMYSSGSPGPTMQIFNEYLHQMVLLRDALLPFENFEDVVIPIEAKYRRKRGIGHTEEMRSRFLREMSKKHVAQASVVRLAQCLLTPRLRSNKDVYGFQYKYGTILPSFVTGGSSLRLLRYIPATLDASREQIAFCHKAHECYTAPGRDMLTVDPWLGARCTTQQAVLKVLPADKAALAAVELLLHATDGSTARIDLGQVACGRRCAYTIRDISAAAQSQGGAAVQSYSAWQILRMSNAGLVSATQGIHHIQATSNVELLALLGKLYPKNVLVMKKGQLLQQLGEAAQMLPPGGHFIIELLDCTAPLQLYNTHDGQIH